MISFITGTVQAVQDQTVFVAVGTIGLALSVAQSSNFSNNQEVTLFVHLHWNQESGPSLFGFKTEAERAVFLLIISCSGIGPKIALSILAQMGPAQFVRAINCGDEKTLSKVNGIGLKKAEQMIVQLKHKIAKFIETDGVQLQESSPDQWCTVTQALESLNYSKVEIAAATRYLHEKCAQQNLPFDGLMRHALSFLAKKS